MLVHAFTYHAILKASCGSLEVELMRGGCEGDAVEIVRWLVLVATAKYEVIFGRCRGRSRDAKDCDWLSQKARQAKHQSRYLEFRAL